MRIAVVLLCAGSGTRMKLDKSKMLIELGNKTVLERSVSAFSNTPNVVQTIVVCRECDMQTYKTILKEYKVDFAIGGETRQQSTLNAISIIQDVDFVAIHDGARPLITEESIAKVIDIAIKNGAAAVGVPVKDTIKRVNKNSLIVETVDRNELFSIQTPQVFDFKSYKKLFATATDKGFDFTDDCQIFESNGMDVVAVYGDYNNIKITTQEDINLAISILETRGELL